MTFTDAQRWLLARLRSAPGGHLDDLPIFPGMTRDLMEEECRPLIERRIVRVVGPPNLNAVNGQDIDEIGLTATGVGYAQRV